MSVGLLAREDKIGSGLYIGLIGKEECSGVYGHGARFAGMKSC